MERGKGFRKVAARALENKPAAKLSKSRKYKASPLSRTHTNRSFNKFVKRLEKESQRENEEFKRNFPTTKNFWNYFEREMEKLK
jgi:hypothetical protein